ncbi:MAG: sulfatase-like hydrolase/transferase [Planctomycetes bacterium]|jgi:arylsulfatase A-like enzyme|nr:sulfatase-like hydrolase/transferase [Planctomycetota bacterium]MBT4028967.1 sulfatase-like hydrolase/transferase [Planctomycetota bacterium]MBT4560386.1 sulfatase-like hydrolase/transferase [Planctomycetota bacterium]MBT5101715.1 sulfatase-like hydrolase/transferase [Planctomycetota bacterium]MBT5119456.1 sulfatase-like hydrolase/transferase [Planctomycetota bacterium]
MIHKRIPRLLVIFLAGAIPCAWIGFAESSWLLSMSKHTAHDLAVLPFGVTASSILGGLFAFPIYLLLHSHRRFGASSNERINLLPKAVFIAWLGLVVATDWVRVVLWLPITSPEGLNIFGWVLAATLLTLWFLPTLPNLFGSRVAKERSISSLFAWCIPLVLAWLAPTLLADSVFSYSDLPRQNAVMAEQAGPQPIAADVPNGPANDARPNVVLITLDTTRADHLSVYGYDRDTSPRLEEFAKEAIRFDHAWSASSWTVPSHASMLTGLFPFSHGARYKTSAEHQAELDATFADHNTKIRPLDPEHRTVSEVMLSHGYRTAAFVAGPYLYAYFGMAQGFESYDDRMHVSVAPRLTAYYLLNRFVAELEPDYFRFGHGYLRAEDVNENVFQWLDQHPNERQFLFVNYFDAHDPYWPVKETRHRYPGSELAVNKEEMNDKFKAITTGKDTLSSAEQEWLHSQYDAEIRYMDEHLGKLFDRLKRDEQWDNSLIIITADHGEHLGEHGLVGHGFTVSASSTHIPLLVKYPKADGVRAGVRDYPVHHVDFAATIFERLGLDAIAELGHPTQGRSLLDDSKEHTVLSEIYRDDWRVERFGEQYSRNQFAWTTQKVRLIETQTLDDSSLPIGEADLQLFDVVADQIDKTPLLDQKKQAQLALALSTWRKAAAPFVPSTFLLQLDSSAASAAEAALGETGYAD